MYVLDDDQTIPALNALNLKDREPTILRTTAPRYAADFAIDDAEEDTFLYTDPGSGVYKKNDVQSLNVRIINASDLPEGKEII